MTGTTPNYGFVIPNEDGTDLMDADLWRTPITQMDTILKQKYDALLAMMNGTGNVVLGAPDVTCAAAAGWTLNFFQACARYGMCSMRLTVTKTSPAIANVSDGNIGNVQLITFDIAGANGKKLKPLLGYGQLSPAEAGVVHGSTVYIASASVGAVSINAIAPGGPGIAIGDQISMLGTYAVAV